MAYKSIEEKREYSRQYYLENREALLKKQRIYNKKFRKEHLEEARKKGRLEARKYRKKNKESYNKSQREFKRRKRTEAEELLGGDCFVCRADGKTSRGRPRLAIHEKNGNGHKVKAMFLALKNPKDFVLLCYGHHSFVHDCMTCFGMDWDEIEKRLENHNGF